MTPEQRRRQEDQFVRALIESQQQEEIHQRRERKREALELTNSWKTENQRRRENEETG